MKRIELSEATQRISVCINLMILCILPAQKRRARRTTNRRADQEIIQAQTLSDHQLLQVRHELDCVHPRVEIVGQDEQKVGTVGLGDNGDIRERSERWRDGWRFGLDFGQLDLPQ